MIMKKIILCLLLPSLFVLASDKTNTLKKRIEIKDEKELEVRIQFAAGQMILGKAESEFLFQGVLDYLTTEPTVTYRKSGQDGFLKVDVGNSEDSEDSNITINSLDDFKDNEWDVRLTPLIPMYLGIEMGASKANLDFGGLKIKDMKIETGVADAVINFSEPNSVIMRSLDIDAGVSQFRAENLLNANFEDFSFDGGVGDYELHFDGRRLSRTTDIDIEVGMGSLTVFIPDNVAFRVDCDESLFMSLDVESAYKKDECYFSRNFDAADKYLHFKVDASIGSVDFRIDR